MQNGRVTGELERSEASEEKILALAMADDLDRSAPMTSDAAPSSSANPAIDDAPIRESAGSAPEGTSP